MKSILTWLFTGIVVLTIPSEAAWQDRFEFPEDDDRVMDVWAASESSVYVGMYSGLIRHWNGQNWTAIESPMTSIRRIHGIDDSFYVINSFGMFYCWDNGVWSYIALEGFDSYSAMCGNSRENFYIMVDNEIRQFQDGEWVKILGSDAVYPSVLFRDIHLTRENDLFVTTTRIDCFQAWNPWIHGWVQICVELSPSLYKYDGVGLIPFLNTSDDAYVGVLNAGSTEDLWMYNPGDHGFGRGHHIIHTNGEFFTEAANFPNFSSHATGIQDLNSLFFISEQSLVFWDGLIPYQFPPLADSEIFKSIIDGHHRTDFWITGYDNNRYSLNHWVGPLPEVPAATGAFLKMDDYRVHAGERFHLQVAAANATDEQISGDVYVCMMLFGMDGLWFWPNWTKTPSCIEPVSVTLDPHSFQYFEVLDLTWPDMDANYDGLFHSIMVTDSGSISELQSVGFSGR